MDNLIMWLYVASALAVGIFIGWLAWGDKLHKKNKGYNRDQS